MKAGMLKDLRNMRRITQKEFAEMLGVSQQTVASWEVGRTEPSNEALIKIAAYFKVSTDYLLGNEHLYPKEESILVTSFRKLTDRGKKTILALMGQMEQAV